LSFKDISRLKRDEFATTQQLMMHTEYRVAPIGFNICKMRLGLVAVCLNWIKAWCRCNATGRGQHGRQMIVYEIKYGVLLECAMCVLLESASHLHAREVGY
jgi:hypothetical protein